MSKNMLSDGSILPSTLGLSNSNAPTSVVGNMALRVGIVTEILYPENERNLSGKVIEYNVLVTEKNEGYSATFSFYRNCTVNSVFGSSNNSITQTYTPADKNGSSFSGGSIVMLLCINGYNTGGSAVIIGGLTGDKIGETPKADDGQFYDFNFNGINQKINKDGELTITFNSVLDKNGNKANEEASGTSLKFDKDGGFKISDNKEQSLELNRTEEYTIWQNGNEIIKIDKKNKKIEITSSENVEITANGKVLVSSDDSIEMHSSGDMSLSSDSTAKIDSKQNLNIKSGTNLDVQSGAMTNIKGSGGVNIESQGLTQVKGQLVMLGQNASNPVAIAGVSIAIGPGNLGIPVVSTIITGSSSVLAGT